MAFPSLLCIFCVQRKAKKKGPLRGVKQALVVLPILDMGANEISQSGSCPLSAFPTFCIYMVGSSETSFL